jgi:hypothetical protein
MMHLPLTLLAQHENILWYILPLAIVISAVYSASRYEETESIIARAIRLFFQITIFMSMVLGMLWMLSYRL